MITAREPRLVLAQRPTRRDHLHGAWWPRTTEVGKELAPMLASVTLRFPMVLGVALNRDEWPGTHDAGKPKMFGKTRLSWYGLPESNLAVLHCGDSRRISLLLLAPETPEQIALTASLLASMPGNALTTEQTLLRARSTSIS